MPHADLIVDAIHKATDEVFQTMLGVSLVVAQEDPEKPAELSVVSLIGLTGTWSGTGTLSCSPEGANLVAKHMLMLDVETVGAVDEDTLDAVAELTNMIVGNVKHLLADQFGEIAISIPTVVYGRNFHFKKPSGMTQGCVYYSFENSFFEVKIALAQTSDGLASGRLGAAALTVA